MTETFPGSQLPPAFAPEITVLRDVIPYELKVQFMASDPRQFLRAFKSVSDILQIVDFNCGCPAPTVVGHGAGSSILSEPQTFHETIAFLVEHIGAQRLSVKMRTGYHDESEFEQLVWGIRHLPLSHLTIHGRTRVDRYRGKARWNHMRYAAEHCAFPVIGSGDILGWSDVERLSLAAPNVHSNIVGRGALRNPWIFAELRAGEEVAISGECLVLALASFALIEEAQHHHFDRLIDAAKGGVFTESIGVDALRWRNMFVSLKDICRKNPEAGPSDIDLSKKTLGRVKMAWNYLRSSLPDAFFDPLILRSKSVGQLLAEIAEKWQHFGGLASPVRLRHQPDRDWVYAGQGNVQSHQSVSL